MAEISIDLSSIKAPFLNVMAQKDDQVAPASSSALNNVVGSNDKSMIWGFIAVLALWDPICMRDIYPGN
jgi:poly(3-hydroxyalkanoate) synthetase